MSSGHMHPNPLSLGFCQSPGVYSLGYSLCFRATTEENCWFCQTGEGKQARLMSADNNTNEQLGRTQIHADEAPKIGKYRVLRKIGKGAMGDVWLGHHPELDIPIAIKVLPSHLLTKDPSYLARFTKEARTAARINHHHVNIHKFFRFWTKRFYHRRSNS